MCSLPSAVYSFLRRNRRCAHLDNSGVVDPSCGSQNRKSEAYVTRVQHFRECDEAGHVTGSRPIRSVVSMTSLNASVTIIIIFI